MKEQHRMTSFIWNMHSRQIQRRGVGEELTAEETDWKWKHLGCVFAHSGVMKPSRTHHGKDNLEITEQTLRVGCAAWKMCLMRSLESCLERVTVILVFEWIQKSSNSVIQSERQQVMGHRLFWLQTVVQCTTALGEKFTNNQKVPVASELAEEPIWQNRRTASRAGS